MPSVLTAVTVSDLLHQLGDLPPERVRLQPLPGTATEADVVAVHNREDRLCEFVDGVLVEKTMGYYASYIAATLIRLLGNFVVAHDLGIVAGADGMMHLAPGLVQRGLVWHNAPDLFGCDGLGTVAVMGASPFFHVPPGDRSDSNPTRMAGALHGSALLCCVIGQSRAETLPTSLTRRKTVCSSSAPVYDRSSNPSGRHSPPSASL